MRTRDIITSPVVTLSPDAQLKDVAAILVELGRGRHQHPHHALLRIRSWASASVSQSMAGRL
jgi:hypothetical protein